MLCKLPIILSVVRSALLRGAFCSGVTNSGKLVVLFLQQASKEVIDI